MSAPAERAVWVVRYSDTDNIPTWLLTASGHRSVARFTRYRATTT